MPSSVLNWVLELLGGLEGISVFALLLGVLYFVFRKAVGTAIAVKVKELLGEETDEGTKETDANEEGTVEESSSTPDRTTFERLTDADFEERQVHPENCWRRAFTFTEIAEGYAIDRQRPDEERTNVTEELLESLKDGDQRVILGTPGAGKSTVGKRVAWRWHDDEETGSVLYWRKERGGVLDDSDSLREQIESERDDGPVLVVVEDAARRDTMPVYEVISEKAGADDVSFLLDSREREWHDSGNSMEQHLEIDPTRDYGTEVLGARKSLDPYQVPELDLREVERLVANFENKAERSVEPSSEDLLDRVEAEAGANSMLLLSYHLLIGSGAGRSDGLVSSPLETHVEEVFREIQEGEGFSVESEADRDLLYEVGLLINVLNAAGIEIRQELVHALADEDRDHEQIESFLDALEGKLLFDTVEGTRYLSNHEEWSMLYLEYHLEENDEDAARETFETCVNAVFSVTESESLWERTKRVVRAWVPRLEKGYPTVREQIHTQVESETPYLNEVEQDRTGYADEYVEQVFSLGTARPKFAPLFSTTENSGIEIPDACWGGTEANCSLWRFRMYRRKGEAPEGELDAFRDNASDAGFDAKSIDALQYSEQGLVARREGDYDQAREYYEQSYTITREIGNKRGEANTLNNLGLVAQDQDDYDQAREYHEQSLAIFREIGAVRKSLKAAHDLAMACEAAEDTDAAIEACRTGLEIVSNAEISGLDDRREWFQNKRDELKETAEASS